MTVPINSQPRHSDLGPPGQPAAAIFVRDLVKTYTYHQKQPGLLGSLRGLFRRETRERRAVDGVSFSIRPGEIVGFLGPNGAGKTTTLKVLCGLLYPSAGVVSVLDHVPSRREADFLRRISLVMGQKNMLWWDVPAMETLLLHQDLYGLDDRTFRTTVAELAALLEVEELLKVQVRKLSLGERMKLELLVALVHRPEILFLDEPTIGLDVVSQVRVRDFLRRLNQEQGTTILLTSHYMDDIEALCPRVLVIDDGRIGYDGSLDELVRRVAPHRQVTAVYAQPLSDTDLDALLRIGLGSGAEPATDSRRRGAPHPAKKGGTASASPPRAPRDDEAMASLTRVRGPIDRDGREVRLSVPRDNVPSLVERLLRLGAVVDLKVEDAPIEEIIRQVFAGAVAT